MIGNPTTFVWYEPVERVLRQGAYMDMDMDTDPPAHSWVYVQAALEYGMDDVIQKPIQVESLEKVF